MKSKSLPDEQIKAVRSFLKALIDKDFKGNATDAADKLGLSQPTISTILNKGVGVGFKTVDAIAAYTGVSSEKIRGIEIERSGEPTFGEAVGWVEAEEVVRKDNPGLDIWVFEKARKIRGITAPNPVTPAWMLETLLWVKSTTSDEEIYSRARAKAESALKRVNSAADTREKKRKRKDTELIK